MPIKHFWYNKSGDNMKEHVDLCPVSRRCGACQLLALPYPRQLAEKQRRLEALLGQFGPVSSIWGMEQPAHYRCKVQAAFGAGPRGAVVSGTYEPGSHRLVPVEACLLEDEGAGRILASIRALAKSFHIPIFDDRTGRGLLRHVLIRKGWATGQVLVALVTASPVFPGSRNFVQELCRLHPEVTTVVQNINGRHTSMVLGEQEKVLYGKGFIEDVLCGLTFRISARSFFQVNPLQAQRLYTAAVELAALTGRETVLDAYCGTGTIGLIASLHAGTVVGVEQNSDAVRDATANARKNQRGNVRFVCEDAGEYLARRAAAGPRPDVVFTDPPRAGCSDTFLGALLAAAPARIVYISCNPETLARDLRRLTPQYRVEAIQPVDMFPHTEHIETVALLAKTSRHVGT